MINERTAFFGEQGLTMTSANHVANLAKEFYEGLEAKLNATSFIEERISIIGSLEQTVSRKGTPSIIEDAPKLLMTIAEAKSLIAFLREAIKEKQRLLSAAKALITDEYANLIHPDRPVYLTKEDIIASWNTGEQEKYLSLETGAAVVGKYIHPDGPLSNARKRLHKALQEPVSAELKGRDTIVRELAGCRTEEEVEKLFFDLQKAHREMESELNGLKHKIEVALREDEALKDAEYQKAVDKFTAKQQKVYSKLVDARREEQARVEALRIVIPKRLKSIYDTIVNK